MIHKSFLIDTSALIALLEDEDGADRVEEVLRHESVLITWVSLLEKYYIAVREHGVPEADQRLPWSRERQYSGRSR